MFCNFVVLFFVRKKRREKILSVPIEPVLFFFWREKILGASCEIWRELTLCVLDKFWRQILYTYITNS
jgi:hypothetical protein